MEHELCGSTKVRLGRPKTTNYPLAGRPRAAKPKCAEVTAEPNKNSARMDPGRTAHLSLRTFSRACSGTHGAVSTTPGNVKRVRGAEGHPEWRRGAGASALNWRASSQLKCLHPP